MPPRGADCLRGGKGGPKTKGYTGTILTLYLMALEAGRESGSLTTEAYADCVKNACWKQRPNSCSPTLTARWPGWRATPKACRSFKVVYLAGKLQSAAIAAEGALKLMETLLIPAEGYDFEEYLHGPSCSINPGVAGMYLLPPTGDPDRARMHGLLEYHRSLCSEVYAFGPEAGEDPRDLSLLQSGAWYTQPFEQFCRCRSSAANFRICLALMGLAASGFRRWTRS